MFDLPPMRPGDTFREIAVEPFSHRFLVRIMVRDSKDRVLRHLGSGVIIGGYDRWAVIATAAHVLQYIARDEAYRRVPRHLQYHDEHQKYTKTTLQDVRVGIVLVDGTEVFVQAAYGETPNPGCLRDTAILCCHIPDVVPGRFFEGLPIDLGRLPRATRNCFCGRSRLRRRHL